MTHIALAFLAQIPDPGTNLQGFAQLIFDAVAHKQYWLLASLAVIGLVYVAQKFLTGKFPFLGTDKGQVLLHFLFAFAGAFATALLAGQPVTISLLITALGVALAAVGGLSALSKVFFGAQQIATAQAAGAQAAAKVDGKDAAVSVLGQK